MVSCGPGEIQTCGGEGCLAAAAANDNGEGSGQSRLSAQAASQRKWMILYHYFIYLLFTHVDHPLGPSTSQNSTASVGATIAESHLARATAVRNRLKLSVPSRSLAPTTPLSTNILLHHEHGGGMPGEQKINVAWQVCMTVSEYCIRLFVDMAVM